jgi:SAM-dependent methyltransferase
MIIQYGYYDRPGVWSLAVDPDKKVIAETVGHFKPQRVLELGCSTGAVLKLLLDEKIDAYGVEISHMALALAYVETRHRIFYGDLLQLDLGMDFDFILGMDVFEHLNPNKIGSYLRRCHALLQDDGFLLTNIPVFGNDPIFGEVFPIYLNSWIEDAAKSGLFSTIHVSASGWPLNGHLIWAMTSWWQTHFENAGFTRAVDIEPILHDIYDPFFASSAPARRSFFVWQKQPAGKIRATATRDRLAKIRAEAIPTAGIKDPAR